MVRELQGSILYLYTVSEVLVQLVVLLHFDIFVNMDLVDLLMKELEHQDPPLLPYHRPWITSQAREWIDQFSGDVLPIPRPAHRGPVPSEHDIEPPIMPSEHWLADELPCPAPPAKLSNNMLALGRLPKLPSLLSLWPDPISHPGSIQRTVAAPENASLSKEHTFRTIANSADLAIPGRPPARTCPAEIFGSTKNLTHLCLSYWFYHGRRRQLRGSMTLCKRSY